MLQNVNILKEVHNCFKSHISTTISSEEFMSFIFSSEDMATQSYPDFMPSNADLISYLNGTKELSVQAINFLSCIKQRPLKGFCKRHSSISYETIAPSLREDFLKICQTFNLVIEKDATLDVLLYELIDCHMRMTSFNNYRKTTNYVCFKAKVYRRCGSSVNCSCEDLIANEISHHRQILLYSFPGMGKTELAKSLCQNYKRYGFNDALLLEYHQDLKSTLMQIEFEYLNDSQKSFHVIESTLRKKQYVSLLVINKVPVDSIVDTLAALSKFPISVLVISDTVNCPEGVHGCLFPAFSDNDLKRIFENAYGQGICEDEAKEICELFEKNTLAIRLLGSVLRKTENLDVKTFLKMSRTHLLKSLPLYTGKIKL